MRSSKLALFSLILLVGTNLPAAVEYSFRSDMRHTGQESPGFQYSGALELPFSYSHSSSRSGTSDGNYLQIEGRFKNSLHYLKSIHDWSTSLFLTESYSMSPALEDRWIKSKDLLQFESRYLYNFATWSGIYAHARLQSSIFKGLDIHENEKTYELRNADNSKREELKASEINISEPFLPLFVQENLGLFATIVHDPRFSLETRAAASFRQNFADGQKVLLEENKDRIIIRDLKSYYQIGPLAGTSIGGKIWEDNISYSIGIDAMWPALQSPAAADRSFVDSLNIEGGGNIGYKLNKWFLLSYEYSTKRLPDILEKFQQEHAVHLSLNLDWVYSFAQD